MNRVFILIAAGAFAIAVAVGLNLMMTADDDGPGKLAGKRDPAATDMQGSLDQATTPTFDVVRVNSDGDAVIAGRAARESLVDILANGESLGNVRADQRGEWVFLPPAPLAPGNYRLTLTMTDDAGTVTQSTDEVVLVVPDRPLGTEDGAPVLALKTPTGGGASELMQAPESESKSSVTVDTVDYRTTGPVTIGGRANPGAWVQIYINDLFVSRLQADDSGKWSVEYPVAPGEHKLRADEVTENGQVLARVEFPFVREETGIEIGDDKNLIVQPGNSLWRLARRTLGSGPQFTVIYRANLDRIKDPNLIYPGQVFQVPAPGG